MPTDGEQPKVDLVHVKPSDVGKEITYKQSQDFDVKTGNNKLVDKKYTIQEEDVNRIKDIDIAQQVANTEATQGVNAALKQEAVLTQEKITGLTELQRKNMEVINGLMEKYPYAFENKVSKSGNSLYILKHPSPTEPYEDFLNATPPEELRKINEQQADRKETQLWNNNFIFSKDGLVNIADTYGRSIISEINMDPSILDDTEELIKGVKNDDNYYEKSRISTYNHKDITELRVPDQLNLKDQLVLSNNYNKSKVESPISTKGTTENFLSNF